VTIAVLAAEGLPRLPAWQGDGGRGVDARSDRPGRSYQLARADLADPASLEPHLLGAHAVFLVWPFTSATITSGLAPKAAEIAARHAGPVVYLSAQTAADQPGSFWALVERAIENSGASWTYLRPTGFAANTLMWADQIRSGDVVRWPFGSAARALIDEQDIAAVAVRALTDDRHDGARYVLSGAAVLTQTEQLAAIGHAIGRRLRWEELPQAVLEGLAAAWGDPAFAASALDAWEWFVDHPETVTSTVQDITGVPARTFRDWATANADAFC
jgi:uncharacterized protein YbjT (DUF2867 family)